MKKIVSLMLMIAMLIIAGNCAVYAESSSTYTPDEWAYIAYNEIGSAYCSDIQYLERLGGLWDSLLDKKTWNDVDSSWLLEYSSGGGSGLFEGIKSFCEKLFGTPGKTLQWFAIVDFVGLFVAGIVCAFVLPYDRYGDFEFWKAVGYVIGGFAGGYITAVPTYAFGSFVNDTAENKATLSRIEKHLKQTNSCIDNINRYIDEEKKKKENEE